MLLDLVAVVAAVVMEVVPMVKFPIHPVMKVVLTIVILVMEILVVAVDVAVDGAVVYLPIVLLQLCLHHSPKTLPCLHWYLPTVDASLSMNRLL